MADDLTMDTASVEDAGAEVSDISAESTADFDDSALDTTDDFAEDSFAEDGGEFIEEPETPEISEDISKFEEPDATESVDDTLIAEDTEGVESLSDVEQTETDEISEEVMGSELEEIVENGSEDEIAEDIESSGPATEVVTEMTEKDEEEDDEESSQEDEEFDPINEDEEELEEDSEEENESPENDTEKKEEKELGAEEWQEPKEKEQNKGAEDSIPLSEDGEFEASRKEPANEDGQREGVKLTDDAEAPVDAGAAAGFGAGATAGVGAGVSGADTKESSEYPSTYAERMKQTPKNGWSDARGESHCVSNDQKVNDYLSKAGVSGIEYQNCIPDFTPVSKGNVEIPNMSEKREGAGGNFNQADMLLAEEKGCTPREVKNWRKDNGYTWHECNDMKTCQKIPSCVNSKFGHLGGVSECKKAAAIRGKQEDEFDDI